MGLYHNRIQAPTKTLAADWIPEEGELFRDSAGNLYCGDNVTASNALTPVSNGAQGVKRYVASITQSGTSAPTEDIVIENSQGIAWAYGLPGTYNATLDGTPLAAKIYCSLPNGTAPLAVFDTNLEAMVYVYCNIADGAVDIVTMDASLSPLNLNALRSFPITIIVKP
jgi:hypothetical protein